MWQAGPVKIFISVDMEGVAGIADWAQCLAGGDDYALGRELLLGEVNAAIEGHGRRCHRDFGQRRPLGDAQPATGGLAGRAGYLSGQFNRST